MRLLDIQRWDEDVLETVRRVRLSGASLRRPAQQRRRRVYANGILKPTCGELTSSRLEGKC